MDDVMGNLFSLFFPTRRAVLKIFESKYWIKEVKALVNNVVVTNLSLQLCVPQTVPLSFFGFQVATLLYRKRDIIIRKKTFCTVLRVRLQSVRVQHLRDSR